MASALAVRLAGCSATLVCGLLLAGCTGGSAVAAGAEQPTAAAQVALHAASEPRRAYVIVGFVSAMSRDEGLLVSELQTRAASLGASAVIGLRVTSEQGEWLRGYAIAVRWT